MNKCYHSKKSRFDNRKHAERFIEGLDKIKNDTGVLRPYYCEYCEGYHLTKDPIAHTIPTKLKHGKEFLKYIDK